MHASSLDFQSYYSLVNGRHEETCCCSTWTRNLKRCQRNVLAANDSLTPRSRYGANVSAAAHPAVLVLQFFLLLGYNLHDELIFGGVTVLADSRNAQVIIPCVLFRRYAQQSERCVVPVQPSRQTIATDGLANLKHV